MFEVSSWPSAPADTSDHNDWLSGLLSAAEPSASASGALEDE